MDCELVDGPINRKIILPFSQQLVCGPGAARDTQEHAWRKSIEVFEEGAEDYLSALQQRSLHSSGHPIIFRAPPSDNVAREAQAEGRPA
jgi:hypothetical protein